MTENFSRRAALSLILSPFAAAAVTTTAGAAETWARVQPATVLVLPSLNDGHAANPNYGYDDLYRIVAAFRPDRVGVEIRPEDMTADAASLAESYPADMVALKAQYGDNAFGFDWLGDSATDRPVQAAWRSSGASAFPDDADFNTPDRQLYAARLAQITAKQQALRTSATARGLSDGRYDDLCVAYYDTLRAYLFGTRYEAITSFYTARDAHLAANVTAFVKAHPGERIAVVTSAEHHGPVTRFLRQSLADKVLLARVPKA